MTDDKRYMIEAKLSDDIHYYEKLAKSDFEKLIKKLVWDDKKG